MRGATILREVYDLLRVISIHAPRMGRDAYSKGDKVKHNGFQSTRPVWGATLQVAYGYV